MTLRASDLAPFDFLRPRFRTTFVLGKGHVSDSYGAKAASLTDVGGATVSVRVTGWDPPSDGSVSVDDSKIDTQFQVGSSHTADLKTL